MNTTKYRQSQSFTAKEQQIYDWYREYGAKNGHILLKDYINSRYVPLEHKKVAEIALRDYESVLFDTYQLNTKLHKNHAIIDN